eukprot:gene8379-biopygen38034
MMYKSTGARCSSIHNLLGWNEFGTGDSNELARDKRGQGIKERLLVAPAAVGGGNSPLRWLVIEEAGALNPNTFHALERELRQHCPDEFPRSCDATGGKRSFAGLNIIMVGDFYQLDPVRGPSFWSEDAKARLGVDLLLNEFSAPNFIELNAQCRVSDAAFQREVLHPMRVTDDGPSAAGMKILRARLITKATVKRLNSTGTRLIAYCNSQKDDHMRSRARTFAHASGRRLYWSIAEDRLCGEGTRRAWAKRQSTLLEQKRNWLALDDKKAGRRLGCLPLCVGLPVVLNDHVNRGKGLVAGLQGTIVDIWFKGQPPQKADACGESVCSRVPLGVLVKFNGFPDAIPIGRSAKTFHLGAAGTATSVRRNQIPLLPDFSCTAHLCQGTTMNSALVDLDIPPGVGDTTASFGAAVLKQASTFCCSASAASWIALARAEKNVWVVAERSRAPRLCHLKRCVRVNGTRESVAIDVVYNASQNNDKNAVLSNASVNAKVYFAQEHVNRAALSITHNYLRP